MEDESRAESPVLERRQVTNSCSSIHIILSIVVVLFAIVASYMFTVETPEEQVEEDIEIR